MALLHNRTILLVASTVLSVSLCTAPAFAQTNAYLLNGNKLYEEHKYKEAQDDYMRALKKDPNNTTGLFNLGNSLYQQKLYDSSRKVMAATAGAAKDKNAKSAANYNIGNTYMSQQKWEDAANAYKQTLRNNPQDADAKYNLSYAEEMMKKQQEQKKQQDKNKQDKNKDQQKQQNKDQNKDNKDKDKQDKGQNDKDKNDQNKDQQQPQGQPSKLSQQQADQLLNALQQEEKKLQDKMKKEKGTPVKLDKDW